MHPFGLNPVIALVGLVVGTLVGLSGVGGGSLVTPLLVLALGMQPAVAVGTDLLYSVPTRILGAVVHHRQGTINWRLVKYLTIGSIPAAVLGLVALAVLQQHVGVAGVNTVIKRGLGILLLFVSGSIVLKPILAKLSRTTNQTSAGDEMVWSNGEIVRVVILGAIVGFLVSLTSIGSGSLTVPLLYMLVPRLGLRRLIGSDVAFAAILIPVATAGHLQMGHVDVPLAASLVVGSVPGVVIGSRLCARVPDFWIRPALAGILLFAGTRLI